MLNVRPRLALCVGLCLMATPIIPGIAIACEGKGPKVKVEPKLLSFKELNMGEKEELILTYTNEGPGVWNAEKTIFTKVEGNLNAWNLKPGKVPCAGEIAEKAKCEDIVEFAPKEEKMKFKANVTTVEPSETAVVEGKSK